MVRNLIRDRVRKAKRLTTRTKRDRKTLVESRDNWSAEGSIYERVERDEARRYASQKSDPRVVPPIAVSTPTPFSLHHFVRSFMP